MRTSATTTSHPFYVNPDLKSPYEMRTGKKPDLHTSMPSESYVLFPRLNLNIAPSKLQTRVLLCMLIEYEDNLVMFFDRNRVYVSRDVRFM